MGLSRTVSEINADFSRKSQKKIPTAVYLALPLTQTGLLYGRPFDRTGHLHSWSSWSKTYTPARHRGLELVLSEPFETTSGVRQGCVLAPALFCIAIDWILARCTDAYGITVGSSRFTDQDYADDAVLFTDCPSEWLPILSSFDEAAHTMGLSTSWLKTKIQNLGHREIPDPVQLQGHVVDSTDRFTYLGSDMHSSSDVSVWPRTYSAGWPTSGSSQDWACTWRCGLTMP